MRKHKENNRIYQIVFLKHGILNEKHPLYSTALEYLKKLYEFKSLEEFEKFCDENQEYFEKMCEVLLKRSLFKYNPLNYSSIKWLMDTSTLSNAFVCSLICGGRTANERPHTYFAKSVGDIDISSAYGSQLIKVQFPLGRPRIYFKTANDFQKITLGSFMKKYHHKFSKFKMFKLMVSGFLTFEQDLLLSKVYSVASSDKRLKNFTNLEAGQQTVPSHFLLLRKQLIN